MTLRVSPLVPCDPAKVSYSVTDNASLSLSVVERRGGKGNAIEKMPLFCNVQLELG
jgi:hypothetical protein